MKIALIGYGKMGKAIERLAQDDHQVLLKIGRNNAHELTAENLADIDVAIEFSLPETAFDNIKICLEAGIPVVSGTTGWLDRKSEIHELCQSLNGTFFYASNFSLGVNLFFDLNKKLASIMSRFPQYRVEMSETHHIHKVDAPSGTGITLAEGIIDNHPTYEQWSLQQSSDKEKILIRSFREGAVPGTHNVKYTSRLDRITIEHEAFTRDSFAEGALIAAEWIIDKKGILTMADLMQAS